MSRRLNRKLIDEFTLSSSLLTLLDQSGAYKVNFLAWKIKLDNLPTRLNISRRGMDIDSILCPTCDKAVESTRHIFFTCLIARDILHLITSWWNIPYMEEQEGTSVWATGCVTTKGFGVQVLEHQGAEAIID
ncbi:RNA-directed DNA polymerase, eukaryota [Tanacetum coccineum]